MAKSAQVRMDDKIHSKIVSYAKQNRITIPDAINTILKNHFKFAKSGEELFSKEEIKEVFNTCLNNIK